MLKYCHIFNNSFSLYNRENDDVWMFENANFGGFSNLRFLGNSFIWITSNEVSKKLELKVTLHAFFFF